MSDLFRLTKALIARLEPFFPKSHGKPRVDDRRVLSGVIFINRNGLRWCDAPREHGPPETLCNRWKRRRRMGVFTRIMTGLASEAADDIAQDDFIAICHRHEGESHIGAVGQDVSGSGCLGQRPPGRNVIGMEMGIDHMADLHLRRLGGIEIRLDVADRVNHQSGGPATAAEEIGDADRVETEKLPQDHFVDLRRVSGYASFNYSTE